MQDPAALPYATGQQQLENGHDFMTQAQIHSRSVALQMRQVSLLQGFSHEASIRCWHNNAVLACLPHMLQMPAALLCQHLMHTCTFCFHVLYTEVTGGQLPDMY